jgi:hypothetical protein
MKKNKIIAVCIFVFNAIVVFAQDTIVRIDGSRVYANVVEVNPLSVKYSSDKMSGDKLTEIKKTMIFRITFGNGSTEYFSPLSSAINYQSEIIEGPAKVYGKNVIAVNAVEMIFTHFGISYERFLKSGKYSVKIPFSFGLGGKPNVREYLATSFRTTYIQDKIIASGLEFNVYPYGLTRHTLYLGINGELGTFNYYSRYNTNYYNTYNNYNYNYSPVYLKHTGVHYAIMLHIGGYLALSDKFMIGGKIGAGYKYEETIFTDYTSPNLQIDLNLAYRF